MSSFKIYEFEMLEMKILLLVLKGLKGSFIMFAPIKYMLPVLQEVD
jgi:hypothetical protein